MRDMPMTATAEAQPRTDWKLVIHGGAGVIERSSLTPQKDAAVRAGLSEALAAGERVLSSGGAAVDAVEAAVRALEEDPHFNAGRGSVFTYEATHELDASIMDGSNRAAGAVAGVSTTRSPIALARAVMAKSPHVMLSREGADEFAREHGLEQVPNSHFSTPERREQLDRLKAHKVSALEVEYKFGTVGGGGGRAWPCRGGDLDRWNDRQALGPDRGFAGDRRGLLRRRPRLRRLGDRARRIFSPRGRRARDQRANAAGWRGCSGGGGCGHGGGEGARR